MAEVRATQTTVQKKIEGALGLLGKLAPGQDATTAELSDGLRRFNDLLESWNLDANLTYENSRDTFTMVSNRNPHTIGKSINGGPAGDFDAVRPLDIEAASVIAAGETNEIPMSILSKERYQDIPVKGTSNPYPRSLWYEREFPLGKIHLYPVPSAASKLVLYVRQQLDTGLVLADKLSLPPGYARALEYALAVEFAPEYGIVPSNEVMRIAKEARAVLARVNDNEPPFIAPDPALLAVSEFGNRRYNVRTGQYDGGIN